MNKINKKFVVALVASTLGIVGVAFAVGPDTINGGNAAGTNTTSRVTPAERNNSVNQGFSLLLREKGAKTFNIQNTTSPQLVVDESSNTLRAGGLLVGVDISSSSNNCFLTVFDSSSTIGIANSFGPRSLMPPVVSTGTYTTTLQLAVPLQFNNGLVGSVSAAGCQASLHYTRNGGKD